MRAKHYSYFKKKLRNRYENETAASLVRALDYIPLAITQAAAFILRQWPRISSSIYLEEFPKSENNKGSMLYKNYGGLRRDAEATNSVVLTWQITFEQIQKERRSAAKLLSFMSLFHPQEIPKWILRSYYTKRHEYGSNNYESNYHEGGENDDNSRELNELYDDIVSDKSSHLRCWRLRSADQLPTGLVLSGAPGPPTFKSRRLVDSSSTEQHTTTRE
jgi:hypothetical protein